MEWWKDASYFGSYIFEIAEDLEGARTNTAIGITETQAQAHIKGWKDPESKRVKGYRPWREDPTDISGPPEDWDPGPVPLHC